MKGHSGICRAVKNFGTPALAEVAGSVEERFHEEFAAHDASLRVVPIRISHLARVGEGVQLDVAPHDVESWERWGDFESDVEVRWRRRFSRTWHEAMGAHEVKSWLDVEARSYLAELERRPDSETAVD